MSNKNETTIDGKIYLISNQETGKSYIGQTKKELEDRFKEHCLLKSECTYLKNAIQAHGKEKFNIVLIDTATTTEELDKKEEFWIQKLGTFENGYNLTTGGKRPKMSPETLEKMSKIKIGHFVSEETKKKISLSNMGKTHSQETKIFLSKLKLGKKNSLETNAKIKKANLGKKRSQEAKEKYRKAQFVAIQCVESGVVFESLIAAGKTMGISRQLISDVLRGRYKKAKGFTFKYVK